MRFAPMRFASMRFAPMCFAYMVSSLTFICTKKPRSFLGFGAFF